jgi:hypothetical protein
MKYLLTSLCILALSGCELISSDVTEADDQRTQELITAAEQDPTIKLTGCEEFVVDSSRIDEYSLLPFFLKPTAEASLDGKNFTVSMLLSNDGDIPYKIRSATVGIGNSGGHIDEVYKASPSEILITEYTADGLCIAEDSRELYKIKGSYTGPLGDLSYVTLTLITVDPSGREDEIIYSLAEHYTPAREYLTINREYVNNF